MICSGSFTGRVSVRQESNYLVCLSNYVCIEQCCVCNFGDYFTGFSLITSYTEQQPDELMHTVKYKVYFHWTSSSSEGRWAIRLLNDTQPVHPAYSFPLQRFSPCSPGNLRLGLFIPTNSKQLQRPSHLTHWKIRPYFNSTHTSLSPKIQNSMTFRKEKP